MDDGSGGGLGGIIFMVVFLGIMIFFVAAGWRLFEKAGRAGWECLIPFYNLYVMTQIVGMPVWSILLCFVPFVGGIIFQIWWAVYLARSFGKDTVYAIGIMLLGFIFIPLLAFGDAEYIGPAA
ncbi:MAG: DUF5684 domain-containing protein [Vulcanimicrobiota bacterium]